MRQPKSRYKLLLMFIVVVLCGIYASQSLLADEANLTTVADQTVPQNLQLVNGIFASGSVSSRLSSDNYQMISTFGEPALPLTTTTIMSNNFRHQPGFLATAPFTTASPTLLAIYVLAFDTNPLSNGFLVPYFEPLLGSIMHASQNDSTKTAVVLADLAGDKDTAIHIIQSGKVTTIRGLPNESGVLEQYNGEYNLGDGAVLGGFLKWTRQNYLATNTTLTFVGHNGPVVADADYEELFTTTAATNNAQRPPRRIIAPDKTDYHPQTMLSTYQLALALQIGTQGFEQFAVIDLMHCFSGSIEELYEIAPYTKTIIASPNYTYINPYMIGKALTALQTTMTSAQMATTLIDTYNQNIPNENHPRILVAIDAAKLAAVKTSWDVASHYILEAFQSNPTATKAKITAAYNQSVKYDTSFCDKSDWRLQPPDGLSDFVDFAEQLELGFGSTSPVGIWSHTTIENLQAAVIASHKQSGAPWFGLPANQPSWNFDGYTGIALYTDFQTFSYDGRTYLNWQSEWYKKTVSSQNPNPYLFIRDGFMGHSWADVFARFWQGQSFDSIMCFPIFPSAQDTAELELDHILSPLPATVSLGSPVRLSAVLKTSEIVINPLVSFEVTQNNTIVFSSTVHTSLVMTGTRQVDASKYWIPTASGPFTITIIVDPSNEIIEPNESNNVITMADSVVPSLPNPRPMITANVVNNLQWITQTVVPLRVSQLISTTSAPVNRLTIQVYQYQPDQNPSAYVPIKRSEQTVAAGNLQALNFTLPATVQPGPVVLHIWGYSAGGISVDAAIVRFNYIPSTIPLPASATHYYLLEGKMSEPFELRLNLAINTNANLVAWYPSHYMRPNLEVITPVGNKPLKFESLPFVGWYVIGVVGSTAPATTYSLNPIPNGAPDHPTNLQREPNADLPRVRPIFQEPLTLEPFPFHISLPFVTR